MTNKTKRRDPFANLQAQAPIDLIPSPEKKKHDRSWERQNRAYSYSIPRPLWEAAHEIRTEILSIAQYDEAGNEREDRTTVNAVASVLMDWALVQVEQGLAQLAPRHNPRSRGQLTVLWEEWSSWEPQPILLPEPKRLRQVKSENLFLAYRWTKADIDQRLKILAGKNEGVSPASKNPFKHTVPVGEIVVKLFQLAIAGYKSRRFKVKTERITIDQMVDGWGRARSK